MPATFPATKAETWADAIILRPKVEPDPADMDVPRFALLETRGLDPRAFLLSVVILTSLVYLSIALGRFPSVTQSPPEWTVTLIMPPPALQMPPDISTAKNPREVSALLPMAKEPDADTPSLPEPAMSRPEPIKSEPPAPEIVAAKSNLPEIVEKPTPVPVQPDPAVASPARAEAPAVVEPPKPSPAPVPQPAINNVAAHDLKAADSAAPARVAAPDASPAGPASLGGAPLSQLIDAQDALAASLAALPSAARLGLPRVSIRVNAEWVEALPKTQERLYFSITTPEQDREVLAYLPDSHSFNLERPERPLWKIYDGDRVPALADLRVAAGRWLGVSPNLVSLYTWHPPVFEDAIRMFVLERMQELGVHLGPRDVVTVRLAAGPAGTVMNLEPLHEDASQ
jgi:hypothetical protein